MTAIEARELTKYWGQTCAVDDINFKVEAGEVFGFLGPNGAGKTSTIKMLVGLTRPTGGSATVAGYDIVKEPTEVKRRIGVVPEASNLYDELTVYENLEFVSKLYHLKPGFRKEKIKELIDLFQLRNYQDRRFGKLSKGLKRRIVLSAALLHEPQILFMDEPTSGLDVMSARSLREVISRLAEGGVTIFLTTHYIEEAGQLCDRVAIIVNGRIIVVESPEALRGRVQDTPLLSIETDYELTIESLRDVPAVDIRVNDERVFISTRDLNASLSAFMKIAEAKEIKVKNVQTLKPTLEDAFIQLTGLTIESMKMEARK